MSEMQRADDVGAVLRLLPHILCLEMHQLRRDYRSHNFQQSQKKSGCTGQSTGVCQLTLNRYSRSPDPIKTVKSSSLDRVVDPLKIRCGAKYNGFLINGQSALLRSSFRFDPSRHTLLIRPFLPRHFVA